MPKKFKLQPAYFEYENLKEGGFLTSPKWESEESLMERLNTWIGEMQEADPSFRVVNVEHLIAVRGSDGAEQCSYWTGRCVWYTVNV